MATPTTTSFITEISNLIAAKDSQKLAQFLIIEPPYSSSYENIIQELRSAHPKGSSDDALEAKVNAGLSSIKDTDFGGNGSNWAAFVKFLTVYFGFLRDVNVANLLETYNLLSELLQKANSALTHPTYGTLILPTVVQYSRVLSRLAIGLDKQPHLIAHLTPKSASGDDGGPRETLPERAANILRQAFVTCLNDRTGSSPTGLDRAGKPEGKKRGIYTIANLCLKILFSCRKTRGCAQIFENIYNQSPPLSAYPKSERVTYLYYLGRFLWGNGHAYRGQKALQAAYNECHPQTLPQRRLILIFLISSNLVCGRFPSRALLSRPEAAGLAEKFLPVCTHISRGDICSFRRHLDVGSTHYPWFSHHRLDLQLRNRCEVLVWRSLVRKTFLINGNAGDAERRVAPTIDLNDVLILLRWQERKYLTPAHQSQPVAYTDPDFEGLGLETGAEGAGEEYDEQVLLLPTINAVFSKLSSLIHQDFLNGYISFPQRKFAIQGARQKGPLPAGFPRIWTQVEKRANEEVPGWKGEQRKQIGGFGGGGDSAAGVFGGAAKPFGGGGMVVNLSGARPAGASPFG